MSNFLNFFINFFSRRKFRSEIVAEVFINTFAISRVSTMTSVWLLQSYGQFKPLSPTIFEPFYFHKNQMIDVEKFTDFRLIEYQLIYLNFKLSY